MPIYHRAHAWRGQDMNSALWFQSQTLCTANHQPRPPLYCASLTSQILSERQPFFTWPPGKGEQWSFQAFGETTEAKLSQIIKLISFVQSLSSASLTTKSEMISTGNNPLVTLFLWMEIQRKIAVGSAAVMCAKLPPCSPTTANNTICSA